MKCVVVYPNNSEARQAIFSKLIEWSKQVNLEEREINTPHFRVMPRWPNQDILNSFPLNLQAEEVFLKEDKIITLRKLVIDIETELVLEKTLEKIEIQTELPIINQ